MGRTRMKDKVAKVVKTVKEAKNKAAEKSAPKKAKKLNALKTSKDYEAKDCKYYSFDHFWAMMAFKHKLKSNWKSALKAHIKKMGFDSSDKYEEGLKHFLGK